MASSHGARLYVEPVVQQQQQAAAGDATAAGDGSGHVPHMIAVEPHVGELSPVELLQRARWYIFVSLLAVAVALAARLAYQLAARYRRENVPDKAGLPADRHSVRLLRIGSKKVLI